MHDASKRLADSLFDSYESDWAGEEDLGAIVEVSVIISGNERTSPVLTLQFFAVKVQKQQNSPIARGPKTISPSIFIHN